MRHSEELRKNGQLACKAVFVVPGAFANTQADIGLAAGSQPYVTGLHRQALRRHGKGADCRKRPERQSTKGLGIFNAAGIESNV